MMGNFSYKSKMWKKVVKTHQHDLHSNERGVASLKPFSNRPYTTAKKKGNKIESLMQATRAQTQDPRQRSQWIKYNMWIMNKNVLASLPIAKSDIEKKNGKLTFGDLLDRPILIPKIYVFSSSTNLTE